MGIRTRVVNFRRRNHELREKYPIVKILAHNRLQECRRAFNQKESESSEIEIVQQERVKLSIITLLKDYLALTVQYFHFQCNNILYTVFVNE